MTRSDLIEKLAEQKSLPNSVAEKVIHEMFDYMAKTLVAGGGIEVRGFGSFEIREYDGRKARNPKSGEIIAVEPKKRPFFKTGKDLRERIEASSLA